LSPLSVDLDAAVPFEGGAQQAPVVGQNAGVTVAERVQEPRGALDVCEQEGDAARRELPHGPSMAPCRRSVKGQPKP
jgi:hypothetical protein